MSHEGHCVIIKLLEEISNNYNINLLQDMKSFGAFICGIDSYSGQSFLEHTDAAIFGYSENTIQNVWEDIKYVDLCILVERNSFQTMNTAILGEIEGNNAVKLYRESFWDKKSSFCSFGIGVRDKQDNITVQNVRTDRGIKTIFSLGSNFPVIEDFKIAIGILETFFSMSPNHTLQFIPGQKEVVEIIRYHWHKPVVQLITTLRGMIKNVESASLGTNALSMHSVPKIIIN